MSPVSLGLDALLILLLATAVAVGVRLNRKLKDLKDSQAGFIKAVGELDAAALRAESGLSALRDATTEAHDQLLTRIETARGLAARLDRVLPETETAIAEARAATEAANAAAAAARRAAAVRPVAVPSPAPPRALDEGSVVTLHDRVGPARPTEVEFEIPTAANVAAAERAAALFLERRALGLSAGPAADPLQDLDPEPAYHRPASRLARFKARRAGGRA